MSAEENKALYRRLMDEVFNQRRLDRLGAFLAPDVVRHGHGTRATQRGQEAVAALHQHAAAFLDAFPDLRIAIEDLIAEGDRVAARTVVTGTHRGAFLGIPATGKRVTVPAIDIVRVADGRIVDYWAMADTLGLMQQLGAVAPLGQAAREPERPSDKP